MNYTFILMQLLYSAVIWIVGSLSFYFITTLIDIPGNKKIDRIYESEKEKRERNRRKHTILKIYMLVLAAVILIINLLLSFM